MQNKNSKEKSEETKYQSKKEKNIPLNSKGYGIVSKIAMQDNRLNVVSKAIYSYLRCFVNKDKICFPLKDTICSELKISKNTFEKYLKELISCGYISVSRKRNNGRFSHNIYYFSDEITIPQNIIPNNIKPDIIRPDEVTTNNTIFNNTISNNTIFNNTTSTTYSNYNIYNSGGGVFDYYKKYINPKISDIEVSELKKWLEKGFEEKVIEECIQIAVKNNKKFINYISGILNRLEQQNTKTYEQYIKNKKSYGNKKGGIEYAEQPDTGKQEKLYGNTY